jgi:hypothetical protein
MMTGVAPTRRIIDELVEIRHRADTRFCLALGCENAKQIAVTYALDDEALQPHQDPITSDSGDTIETRQPPIPPQGLPLIL